MITDGRVDRVRAQARLDVENASRARAMALIEQRSTDNAEISDLDAAHFALSSAAAGCQTKTAATEGAGFSLLTPAPATARLHHQERSAIRQPGGRQQPDVPARGRLHEVTATRMTGA
jgi:hypothetical protein